MAPNRGLSLGPIPIIGASVWRSRRLPSIATFDSQLWQITLSLTLHQYIVMPIDLLMTQSAIEQCQPCKSDGGGLLEPQWPSCNLEGGRPYQILTARSFKIAGRKDWANLGTYVNIMRLWEGCMCEMDHGGRMLLILSIPLSNHGPRDMDPDHPPLAQGTRSLHEYPSRQCYHDEVAAGIR